MTLLSLTEVVLGPIWVWLWIGEVAGILTLCGGFIVLAAITASALAGVRPRPKPPRAPV
jgi:drug/metabolite transporter (DMT)-like permease